MLIPSEEYGNKEERWGEVRVLRTGPLEQHLGIHLYREPRVKKSLMRFLPYKYDLKDSY